VGILKRIAMTVAVTGAASVAATAGIVATASAQAAASGMVALPVSTYSHMLIDPAHQHIFFTGGPSSTSILVTDYSGNTVATIPNEAGATGLALSSDGSTVYAALAQGEAISAISTSTLTETTRYATGTNAEPADIAYTSGTIWFSYNSATQSGIGSITPATSVVTLNATNDPINTWYAAPILAASANGELAAGEPNQSPVQLATYNVSSGTATVLAPKYLDQNADNLQSMQITPDGSELVTASASSYEQVYKVSDLSYDGEYPTGAFPDSVSISADGTVAAGTYSVNNEVLVFAPGGSTPLNTYGFGSNWPATNGVALTPDGSELFVVTTVNGSGSNPTLNIIPGPERAPATLSLTGPATARRGQVITLSGTLGGPSSDVGGQVLAVTRIDPAHPNGVTLPPVTTAADGSFSFTDKAPGTRGQDESTVTYQVAYAGDTHLSPAATSAYVTVYNQGS
jgi:hypothetical protein